MVAFLLASCRLVAILAALVTASAFPAVAQTYLSQEICGDGIDNDNSAAAGWGAAINALAAGDAVCSGIEDKDRDGYTTNDCDDTDRWLFPGQVRTTGCSAGQYKLCQADGTLTSCHAFQCSDFSSTNSCFFVSTTGDNTAAGTVGAPWLNFKPFTNSPGAGITTRTPTAGDVFLVRAGTYSTNVDADNSMLRINSKDGTAADPIKLMSYPGERVIISSPNTSGTPGTLLTLTWILADYWEVRGLEFTGGYGAPIYIEGTSTTATSFKVIGNFFNNFTGPIANNSSAVNAATGSYGVEFANNLVYNNAGFTFFQANAAGTSPNSAHHNVMFMNDRGVTCPPGADPISKCISAGAVKHGCNGAGCLGLRIYGNVIFNYPHSDSAIWGSMESLQVDHNIFVQNPGGAIGLWGDNGGGNGTIGSNNVHHNTIIDSAPAIIARTLNLARGTPSSLSLANNVVTDSSANYTGASSGLIVTDTATGGTANTNYSTWNSLFNVSGNCYYNAGLTALTGAFEWFPGAGSGSSNNFSAWQGLGKDTTGDNANPTLASGSLLVTTGSCVGRGAVVSDALPTPTPSPTASPTPLPNSGRGNVFAQ